MIERSCSVAGCGAPAKARGLCSKHWKRHRYGKPFTYKSRFEKSINERFWEKVDKGGPDDCWNWKAGTRGTSTHRYGRFWTGSKFVSAHRFSFELANGPIPDSSDPRDNGVCHRCDNTMCVNPKHLYLGTHFDNMQDKANRGRDTGANKMFCKHGHPRTPENIWVSKKGIKHCRVCHRDKEKRRRDQLRATNCERRIGC